MGETILPHRKRITLARDLKFGPLFDIDLDRIDDQSIYRECDVDFATPHQRSRDGQVDLIEADETALRPGVLNFNALTTQLCRCGRFQRRWQT